MQINNVPIDIDVNNKNLNEINQIPFFLTKRRKMKRNNLNVLGVKKIETNKKRGRLKKLNDDVKIDNVLMDIDEDESLKKDTVIHNKYSKNNINCKILTYFLRYMIGFF